MIQIGVDFGGTKIEAAALDAAGHIIQRLRTQNPGSYEAALRDVRDLVTGLETQIGETGTLGICTPGSVSPTTGVMRNSNSLYLNGRRFREDLSEALGRQVRLANDANCFALSEAIDGAGADAPVVFGVILGTGCGGGLVVNQQLINGHNGITGEWGHIPLPWPHPEEAPGPACYCGQHGCLEQWISGTGLARDYAEQARTNRPAEEIIEAFRNGDPESGAAFHRLVDRIGRALSVVCDIVDPDVFVLGGGLSNVPEIYAPLPHLIGGRVFSDAWRGKIAPAKWGDSSGVRGAGRLWSLAERSPSHVKA